MNESGTFIRLALAFLTAHDNKWSFGVLARYVCEKYARQKGTKQDGCTSKASDGNKSRKNKGHEDDVGDMVEARKAVFNELAEKRRKDPFGDDGRYDGHAYRCHYGTPNKPTQIDIIAIV